MAVKLDKVEILLVEDNPTDAELCTRALREHNLANELTWVKDGAEALDFLFREGAYAGRNSVETLKVVLLDLRLPKVNGLEYFEWLDLLHAVQDARDRFVMVELGAGYGRWAVRAATRPSGSGLFLKSRFRRYSSSGIIPQGRWLRLAGSCA